jgi:hypothetical protein
MKSYSEEEANGVVDDCDEESNQDGQEARFIFF